ncbi:MAG: hypothetical protein O7C75_04190, partial [Verrucomicrobia bacterium]|nr:hypothetical protein [Verrucomicrobiota bacterium]
YCQTVRIRESIGEITLINARDDSAIVREITGKGLNLDQGMVLKIDDCLYYGADTIHALALLGSRSGVFNKINYWIFKSELRSRILYPVLRVGRNMLLKVLGRTKVNNLNKDVANKL